MHGQQNIKVVLQFDNSYSDIRLNCSVCYSNANTQP